MTRAYLAGSLLLLSVTACGIPKEKYNDTLARLEQCQADRDKCKKEKDAQHADLDGKLTACTKETERVKGERAEAEKLVADTQANLKATRAELEDLRKQRAEAEKRLAAFKALTAKFQKMIDTGKIKVRIRGGRMMVELPAGILFASGRADLSKEGQTALGEVAEILKEFPDRHFVIAGHTDNVPLRGSKFKDNWDLSTARASTVTKYLIGAGMNPAMLAAAGYGEYDPVGDNTNEEGRQLNRRIEIILVPNIEELPGMPAEDATKS